MTSTPFFRLFARYFYGTTMPYGLGLVAFAVILAGDMYIGLAMGLAGAVVFGLLMALPLVVITHLTVEPEFWNETDDPLSWQQERSLVLPLGRDEAYALCEESVSVFDKRVPQTHNADRDVLEVVVGGFSRRSFGEILRFEFQALDARHTQVRVSSRLRFALLLVDYGKNVENLSAVLRFIKDADKQRLKQKQVVSEPSDLPAVADVTK